MQMVNMNLHFGRQKIVAVVDVAPGAASVSIVELTSSSTPAVLASASSALSLESRSLDEDKSFVAAQMREAGKSALDQYEAGGIRSAIDTAYIFLHAPWVRTILLRAEEKFENPVRIQSAHISPLVKKSIENNPEARAMRLYEGSVSRVTLNGYPTDAPEGKYAQTIRVASIASEAEVGIVQDTESALHTLFPVARIVRRSALRAACSFAYTTIPGESFLIIDVGAASTHIASVHNDSLEQEVVPEGVRSILSRVGKGRPAEEVLGNMRLMSKDACSTDSCESLKTSMAAAELELVRVFGEAFSNIASKRHIPNDVLLVVQPDLEPWLSGFFARIDFAQFSTTTLPLTVRTSNVLDSKIDLPTGHNSNASAALLSLVNMEAR